LLLVGVIEGICITTFNREFDHRFPCIKWTAELRADIYNGLLSAEIGPFGRRGAKPPRETGGFDKI
jgi:hypothetical protein